VNENGSIHRIDHRDIILNLFLGNEVEGGPTNIYLRRHGAAIESAPLLGPRSPGTVFVDEHGLTVCGEWNDIAFTLSLTLAQTVTATGRNGSCSLSASAASVQRTPTVISSSGRC
jgi:1,2-beta-oligoglucan phosphorylase